MSVMSSRQSSEDGAHLLSMAPTGKSHTISAKGKRSYQRCRVMVPQVQCIQVRVEVSQAQCIQCLGITDAMYPRQSSGITGTMYPMLGYH
ncbi:hypothetical protein GDO81_028647 [Engystomops pustulosus]|uniref:Uncharacterized protein n=1 Tax=Engystomops pustulosus TaxID=76066 RepID=A0AAV6YJE4_ENGPU|nr:hypothetical protein GDO81_028647 [Engystomops pustulosus]